MGVATAAAMDTADHTVHPTAATALAIAGIPMATGTAVIMATVVITAATAAIMVVITTKPLFELQRPDLVPGAVFIHCCV